MTKIYRSSARCLVAGKRNSENDGLSLTVRKVCIMENTQPTKTKSASVSPADTSDASIKSEVVAVTESDASKISSPATTATMSNGSKKTLTNAELVELRSKAGLVAGALRDFQDAKGLVAVKEVEHTPGVYAVKIYLVVDGASILKDKTADGLDFNIVAAPSGIVAEEK
jgi:hypothetical protein